ncbi:carboxymuconolactone decarboxylase family protein [Marinibaculum pumilum]|uniref:Carboxymuconolactone decarboxylase family protein n=1 Tax=Marinibaculum pumilum TaxID=1766165 RepID=A0ABV7L2E7_9PROT
MSRLPPLSPDRMTPPQKAVHDAIVSGPRGAVQGPFAAWLRSPEMADPAQRLGAFCRFGSTFPPRLSELAILLTARHWTAQFEWWAHARMARDGGLGDAVIDAIREGRRPAEMQEDEAAVHDFCASALRDGRVAEAPYRRVIALFGERGAVELVGIIGYYCMVSLTLNVFEVPVPDGSRPLAPPASPRAGESG